MNINFFKILCSMSGIVLLLVIINPNLLAQDDQNIEFGEEVFTCETQSLAIAQQLDLSCTSGNSLCGGSGNISLGNGAIETLQDASDATIDSMPNATTIRTLSNDAQMPASAIISTEALLPQAIGEVVMVAIGDVALENMGTPRLSAQSDLRVTIATSGQNLNVRAAPSLDARVLGQVANNTELPADALSHDGNWVRVAYEGNIGWLSRNLVTGVPDDGLPVIGLADRDWMQAFNLSTGHGSNCAPSMLMLQTPLNTPALFTINGNDILITSTVVLEITANNQVKITVLHGNAYLGLGDLIARIIEAETGNNPNLNDLLLPAIMNNAPIDLTTLGYDDNTHIFDIVTSLVAGQFINLGSDDSSTPQWNSSNEMQQYLVFETLPHHLLNYPFIIPIGFVDPNTFDNPEIGTYQFISSDASASGLCDGFALLSPRTELHPETTAFSVSGVSLTSTYRFHLTNNDTGMTTTSSGVAPYILTSTAPATIDEGTSFTWYAEALDDSDEVLCTSDSITVSRPEIVVEDTGDFCDDLLIYSPGATMGQFGSTVFSVEPLDGVPYYIFEIRNDTTDRVYTEMVTRARVSSFTTSAERIGPGNSFSWRVRAWANLSGTGFEDVCATEWRAITRPETLENGFVSPDIPDDLCDGFAGTAPQTTFSDYTAFTLVDIPLATYFIIKLVNSDTGVGRVMSTYTPSTDGLYTMPTSYLGGVDAQYEWYAEAYRPSPSLSGVGGLEFLCRTAPISVRYAPPPTDTSASLDCSLNDAIAPLTTFNNNGTTTFEWNAVPNTRYYYISLVKDDGRSILQAQINASQTSFTARTTPDVIGNPSAIRWSVHAFGYGDISTRCIGTPITLMPITPQADEDVGVVPPTIPQCDEHRAISPLTGSVNPDGTTTFEWNAVSGANSYYFSLSKRNWQSLRGIRVQAPITSVTVDTSDADIQAEEEVFWHVIASGSDLTGTRCELNRTSLATSSTPPVLDCDEVTLISPVFGSFQPDESITFEWSSVDWAQYYRFELTGDGGLYQSYLLTAPDTSLTLSAFADADYFSWRVIAFTDSSLSISCESDLASLQTDSPASTNTPPDNSGRADSPFCNLFIPVPVPRNPFDGFVYALSDHPILGDQNGRSVWTLAIDNNNDGEITPDEMLFSETQPTGVLIGLNQPLSDNLVGSSPIAIDLSLEDNRLGGLINPIFLQRYSNPFDPQAQPTIDLSEARWYLSLYEQLNGQFVSRCLDPDDIELITQPVGTNISTSNGVGCSTFAITSPLDGLAYGMSSIFWNPAPNATTYIVSVSREGSIVASEQVNAPTTNLSLDTGFAIGQGLQFTLTVEALANGRVICTDNQQLLRSAAPPQIQSDAPPTVSSPVCGNQFCETGETIASCSADCQCVFNGICDPWESSATCSNECP